MLPTFIIAGAAKSGTTTLWTYLNEHPEVGMAPIKEPMFFTKFKGTRCGANPKMPIHSGRYHKGVAWYENLFRSCNEKKARGEASTIYMTVEDTPGLIKQVVPDVKLIFILRDPVKRLYSNYWQERKLGWPLPSFFEMVQKRHLNFERYLYASSYHIHLRRYLETFPKEQLSVFLYEDLSQNPQQFMRDVYRAIGVNPEFIPPSLGQKYNATRLPKVVSAQRLLSALTKIAMDMNLPPWLHTRLVKVRQVLVNFNSTPAQYPPMDPTLRQELMEELSEGIDYVEDYLNRPLPLWRKI